MSAACWMLPAFREWTWLLAIWSISACKRALNISVSGPQTCDALPDRLPRLPQVKKLEFNSFRCTHINADGVSAAALGGLTELDSQLNAAQARCGIKQPHGRVIEPWPRVSMRKSQLPQADGDKSISTCSGEKADGQ